MEKIINIYYVCIFVIERNIYVKFVKHFIQNALFSLVLFSIFLNILDIGVNAYVSVEEKWKLRSKKTDYIKGYFWQI